MTEILSLREIRKVYPGKGRKVAPVVAIDEVDLSLVAGEFVSIVGPSGCGKSTLLYIVGGFLEPSDGTASFKGVPIVGPARARGIVFQAYGLFPWKTVLGNVEAGVAARGVARRARRDESRRYLDIVGLSDVEGLYPSALSGGMQQRVAIARTLAQDPELLLMDEPFGALDAQTRLMMQESLLQIWSELRPTVVFVTHDIDEAIFLADRIVVMSASPGRIISEIKVELPRPRTAELTLDASFMALKRQCMALIRAESLRAFEQQNSSAAGR